MTRRVLIIGSGGHGRAVLGCIAALDTFDVVELATNADNPEPIPGYRILDERMMTLDDIASEYDAVVVAIGDNRVRLQKIERLLRAGASLPVIAHPSATVSKFAESGFGTVIMAGAVVNPFARVGVGCVINTGAIVEHDCSVGDGAHLSPNSAMGGGSSLGRRAWLCIGSNVADHVALAADSILAGGSCLVVDAAVSGLYAGVPAVLKREATA